MTAMTDPGVDLDKLLPDLAEVTMAVHADSAEIRCYFYALPDHVEDAMLAVEGIVTRHGLRPLLFKKLGEPDGNGLVNGLIPVRRVYQDGLVSDELAALTKRADAPVSLSPADEEPGHGWVCWLGESILGEGALPSEAIKAARASLEGAA